MPQDKLLGDRGEPSRSSGRITIRHYFVGESFQRYNSLAIFVLVVGELPFAFILWG
jgi:hypothetical protein